jgi:hypothetical protein
VNTADDNTSDTSDTLLSRREIIRRALVAAGFAALAGSGLVASACTRQSERRLATASASFSPEEIAWLDEVAETILPATSTPGAKAAAVGAFIAVMVTDTYSPEQQVAFRDGMNQLEQRCVLACGKPFLSADNTTRHDLLVVVDREAFDYHRTRAEDASPHYFRMIKGLTLLGFFTSEIGYTEAMRYVETPGRFDPCVEYAPGDKAWARHA